MTREDQVEKILDELEEEFAKANMPVNDKLTLFAKVSNAIYKCAEQEPCDDVISRQVAIDLIEDIETKRLKGEIDLIYAPAIKGIKELPSVSVEKTELCTDAISRAEALKHSFPIFDDDGVGYTVVRADKIEQLPPVTPAEKIRQKTGEWQRMSDLAEDEDDRYQCSRCGNVVHYLSKENLYTFNRWCGRCGSNNDRR